MLCELRVYEVLPGKMPALHARFENPVLGLFAKHGIEVIGFWTTAVGEGSNELTYMLKFESMADRDKKWTAFQSDSAWKTARAESENDGPLVARVRNQFLVPTPYSPLK